MDSRTSSGQPYPDLPFGVIWDMDGVLVNTGEFHFLAWQQILGDYGLTMTEQQFRISFGMLNDELLPWLLGEHSSPALVQEIGDRKEVLFRQLARDNVRLLPGVHDWLEALQAAGVRQAIASSAPQMNIDSFVDDLRIRSFFQAIRSGEGMPGKPAPDVFLAAARAIDVLPDRCVVVEDAINGVAGAKNAGMRCVAVTTTNPAPALTQADLVTASLAELSPTIVFRLLQAF